MANNKKKVLKENKPPTLEQLIGDLIESKLKRTQYDLNKKNINEIVKAMMPDLDKMIATKIQNHFIEIGKMMKQVFIKKV